MRSYFTLTCLGKSTGVYMEVSIIGNIIVQYLYHSHVVPEGQCTEPEFGWQENQETFSWFSAQQFI